MAPFRMPRGPRQRYISELSVIEENEHETITLLPSPVLDTVPYALQRVNKNGLVGIPLSPTRTDSATHHHETHHLNPLQSLEEGIGAIVTHQCSVCDLPFSNPCHRCKKLVCQNHRFYGRSTRRAYCADCYESHAWRSTPIKSCFYGSSQLCSLSTARRIAITALGVTLLLSTCILLVVVLTGDTNAASTGVRRMLQMLTRQAKTNTADETPLGMSGGEAGHYDYDVGTRSNLVMYIAIGAGMFTLATLSVALFIHMLRLVQGNAKIRQRKDRAELYEFWGIGGDPDEQMEANTAARGNSSNPKANPKATALGTAPAGLLKVTSSVPICNMKVHHESGEVVVIDNTADHTPPALVSYASESSFVGGPAAGEEVRPRSALSAQQHRDWDILTECSAVVGNDNVYRSINNREDMTIV